MFAEHIKHIVKFSELCNNDTIINEVCDAPENITLCPTCESCLPVTLRSTCFSRKLGYLFDNGGSVFYAIFISFWAVLFLKFWILNLNLKIDGSLMD